MQGEDEGRAMKIWQDALAEIAHLGMKKEEQRA